MRLIKKIVEKYQKEGFLSVLYGFKPYIMHVLLSIIFIILDLITMNRSELIGYSRGDISSWEYGEKIRLKVKSPLSAELPPDFKHLVGFHDCSKNHVHEIRDATLIGPYTIPQTVTGRIILEPMGKKNILKSRTKRTFREIGFFKTIWFYFRQFVIRQNGNTKYKIVASMVPRHGIHNSHCRFGHWIAEDLPRLRGIKKYREETGREPLLLIKPNPPSWMIETLQLLGYSSDDWIEWDEEVAHIDRLVVPTLRYLHTSDYDLCPSDKKWLRDEMLRNIDDNNSQFSEYIFLSRQNADRRRITNYEEVIDTLESYGFQAYNGSNMSIEDQVKMCANAEIIIGVNGGNMTNVLWAADATVVAIYPPDWFGIESFMIANERYLDYDFIIGDASGPKLKEKSFEEDIIVDIDRLTNVIEQII